MTRIDSHFDRFSNEKGDEETCELNCYFYILFVSGIRPDSKSEGGINKNYNGLNSLSTEQVNIFAESNKLWLKLDFIEKKNQPFKKKFELRQMQIYNFKY